MPTPYPKEFRRDVVAVARRGDRSRAQVARSFGISESCLARWLKFADRPTYHRRRRQQTLGRLTPIEFETLFQAAHAA